MARRPDAFVPQWAERAGVSCRLVAIALFAACGAGGAAPGAPCRAPTDCASRLCLQRATGATCAVRCSDASDASRCGGGEVCGAFDFRGLDPDSGIPAGPGNEIVRVCRPPLTAACTPAGTCADPRERCVGGLCILGCAGDTSCRAARCVAVAGSSSCAAPGVCAPPCDDIAECPTGWYCDRTVATRDGHGRCTPRDAADGGGVDGGFRDVCSD